MPTKSTKVEPDDDTSAQRCITQSNARMQESRVLIENSRVTRLASIAAFKIRHEQKAAAKAKK